MVEKARELRRLREGADDCYARFVRSNGEALEELECFAEKHRQTTDLLSLADCPDCYLNYARGLRLLGNYYRTLERKLEGELEDVSGSRSSVLAEKRREAEEKVRHYYTRSNEVFDRYFTARPGGIAYLWASRNAAELEDYDGALDYLDRYVRSLESPGERQRESIEEYRKRLEKLLEAKSFEREQE